jgi:hypothetical protein
MRNKNQGHTVTIPAAITKDDLEQTIPLHGAVNAGQFNGNPPGTLQLRTFAGKYVQSMGKFVGEYRFAATSKPCDKTFAALPGVPNESPAKRKKDEVTHG